MKKLLLTLAFAVLALSAPRARAEISLSFFYDSLEDDGDWFQADDYGYCWQPRGVAEDWSPYTDGYWTYTDEGWTWVSYESFGWATYHYGRWTQLRDHGWVWVPGYEWGPAWVSWRSNDDYVGWAPLPPQAVLRSGYSINNRVDYDYDIGPSFYTFTSCRSFGSPSIRQVIVNRSENVTIINQTTNITNISYRGDVIYNGGLDYDRANRRSERPIEQLRLERITRFDDRSDRRDLRFNRRENGRLAVVAPAVVPVTEALRPRNIKANLGRVEAQHGWSAIRDPRVAEKTREKIRAEHKEKDDGKRDRANRDQNAVQALRQEARQQAVKTNPSQNRGENRLPTRRPGVNDGDRQRAPIPTDRPLRLTDPAPHVPMDRRPQPKPVSPSQPAAPSENPASKKQHGDLPRKDGKHGPGNRPPAQVGSLPPVAPAAVPAPAQPIPADLQRPKRPQLPIKTNNQDNAQRQQAIQQQQARQRAQQENVQRQRAASANQAAVNQAREAQQRNAIAARQQQAQQAATRNQMQAAQAQRNRLQAQLPQARGGNRQMAPQPKDKPSEKPSKDKDKRKKTDKKDDDNR